jgi:hypothetical protein
LADSGRNGNTPCLYDISDLISLKKLKMRKLVFLLLTAMVAFSCGNRQNQGQTAENTPVVYSVDELLASAADHVDQEVVISGLITHVCKHGGQRCFVMGATDDVVIRVEAGDEIDAFKQEYVGDNLQITGVFRLVPVDGGHECSEEEEAAKKQAEITGVAVADSTVVTEEYVPSYFIEGLRFIVLSEGAEEPAEETAAETTDNTKEG